jgi:hypothetical protein
MSEHEASSASEPPSVPEPLVIEPWELDAESDPAVVEAVVVAVAVSSVVPSSRQEEAVKQRQRIQ